MKYSHLLRPILQVGVWFVLGLVTAFICTWLITPADVVHKNVPADVHTEARDS